MQIKYLQKKAILIHISLSRKEIRMVLKHPFLELSNGIKRFSIQDNFY